MNLTTASNLLLQEEQAARQGEVDHLVETVSLGDEALVFKTKAANNQLRGIETRLGDISERMGVIDTVLAKVTYYIITPLTAMLLISVWD